MLDLGRYAETLGHRLDHELTIRMDSLAHYRAEGRLVGHHPATFTRRLLEAIRRWMKARDALWVAVWARERSSGPGEHLHIAMHLPRHLEGAFVEQVADWTGEPIGRLGKFASSPLVATSANSYWDLRRDTRHRPGNPHLLGYLGKDEPNYIRFRNKRRRNERKKLHRKRKPGGRIEGTATHAYRWGFTWRTLGPRNRQAAHVDKC